MSAIFKSLRQIARVRFARVRLARVRFARVRFARVRFAPVRFASVNFVTLNAHARISGKCNAHFLLEKRQGNAEFWQLNGDFWRNYLLIFIF